MRRNAAVLLERDDYLRQLYAANVDLRRRVRRARNDEELDLEAPLTRAVQALRELIHDDGELANEEEARADIEMVVRLLGSDQLFNPDVLKSATGDAGDGAAASGSTPAGDNEVRGWLTDMLTPSAATAMTPGRVSGPAKSDASNANAQTSATSGVSKNDGGRPEDDERPIGLPATKTAEEALKWATAAVVAGPGSVEARALAIAAAGLDDPNFDVLELQRISGGHALFCVAYVAMQRHGMLETGNGSANGGGAALEAAGLRVPEATFLRWLVRVEDAYLASNPYHNAGHAADVTHALQFFATRGRLWGALGPEERLAAVMAPAIHDVGHPGVNNGFAVATQHPLAVRYNDTAVLENFHAASVFEAMAVDPGLDVLALAPAESRRAVRELVVSMVLATDMAAHFDWIGKFKTKVNGAGLNLSLRADRKVVLNMAIKCADVNNPTKPPDLSKVWTDLIMEEFFRQGDEEKRLGIPISTMNDRETTDIPKCQIVRSSCRPR
ncbi:cAMP-specific 3',5'-cyclic phosphodiesterase 4D [Cladochytrium tenue]|nr:cAMP-specific 3',5'-cyclic phosphodiesterase 4D [Cladochytrium tenue]